MSQLMFIIYVANQERSSNFYAEILDTKPILHVPGMTEFKLSEGALLGIMPDKGIGRILGDAVTDPVKGRGIPRCELYLPVADVPEAVKTLLRAGGEVVQDPQIMDWGDLVAYCMDPDGHIIAFAGSAF
ncbi:MAG: hypothetical protein CVV64_18780 [Candidatus Wallbacteria bacterium HGW-Wallbacteria-1]|jgi:predicted enzyme related to lactoylglutathione lyase|uniref:VOC domain-containing protein n=1 Tax=Candidatus Wallbacteria bacterium HGW-Wallbacteria-1 TaxID=2013854 RepID=A0A2N1PJC1_9BACT|nr:MAG: hypothetical protein CVV64_18780 [Candidatus Wallbacteria bacterium HGW-Wallbacteria-1]